MKNLKAPQLQNFKTSTGVKMTKITGSDENKNSITVYFESSKFKDLQNDFIKLIEVQSEEIKTNNK